MVIYSSAPGLKCYSLFSPQKEGQGSIILDTLAVGPGFSVISDEKYQNFALQLEADPRIQLNAEKRRFNGSPSIRPGWAFEYYESKDGALNIWGKENALPMGHCLVNVINVFDMENLEGGVTKVHASLYAIKGDSLMRLGVGGRIVATGHCNDKAVPTWTLEVKPQEWISLCQRYPVVVR